MIIVVFFFHFILITEFFFNQRNKNFSLTHTRTSIQTDFNVNQKITIYDFSDIEIKLFEIIELINK